MRLFLVLLLTLSPLVLQATDALPVSGGESPNGVYRLVLRDSGSVDAQTTIELINVKSNTTSATLVISSYSVFPFLADSSITVCTWSPDSKHFALMTRDSKRTYTTSVYSVGKQLKKITLPNPTGYVLKTQHKTEIFRFLRETPIRWSDSDHVILKMEGDCGSSPEVLLYDGEVSISISSGKISVLKRIITKKEEG